MLVKVPPVLAARKPPQGLELFCDHRITVSLFKGLEMLLEREIIRLEGLMLPFSNTMNGKKHRLPVFRHLKEVYELFCVFLNTHRTLSLLQNCYRILNTNDYCYCVTCCAFHGF